MNLKWRFSVSYQSLHRIASPLVKKAMFIQYTTGGGFEPQCEPFGRAADLRFADDQLRIGCGSLPLVEHTAQHPNSRSVVQTLDLHEHGRIGCGSLPLVEAAGIEPASENHLIRLSPSAAILLGFPSRIAEWQAIRYGSH